MAHELAGALQQAGRIRQRCAVKEPHVYVRSEYIDVAEGRISQTCNRAAVMQKLPNFVPAFSHHLKPLMRDGSQFTCMLFHPRIDGGIPLDSAVESQQIRSHRRSTFCFEICGYVTLLSSLQQNPLSGTVFLVLRIRDRKSTRPNSSHGYISYAVFCLKKRNKKHSHKNTEHHQRAHNHPIPISPTAHHSTDHRLRRSHTMTSHSQPSHILLTSASRATP